ncbi:hypothetical protein [Streptomyces sp. NPDC086776]|uniref:hypothetical protein n=1 Tax=Streptomyces sp. NPDC086776 TaxID=3365756 RepID=UPI0038229723
MPFTPDPYNPNESRAELLGLVDAARVLKRTGLDCPTHLKVLEQNFTAIDRAARDGGRLPDAWHAKPGMQTDHPHMTALAVAGDRVISEENRNILKEKCGYGREATEAYRQLVRENAAPHIIQSALERTVSELENVLKHVQILGVVDGLFEGWEI